MWIGSGLALDRRQRQLPADVVRPAVDRTGGVPGFGSAPVRASRYVTRPRWRGLWNQGSSLGMMSVWISWIWSAGIPTAVAWSRIACGSGAV
jgi:hypothetical protein